MLPPYQIIDISQPISEETACFPGDVPFSHEVTVSYAISQVMNLTQFTMSPHVGTHADAPVHVRGALAVDEEKIGQASLEPYIGPAAVVDVSPCTRAIEWDDVSTQLQAFSAFPQRILFRTRKCRYDQFENDYAWFSTHLIERLGEQNVKLVGLDTPSVDHIDSKTLETHHALLAANMSWLENLSLDQAPKGEYFLFAPPLKLMSLEASPVRAVLLAFK